MSSEDIDKGARWSTDISKKLEASQFGILCVTKDNMNSPWLNFEAGALSKYVENSKVLPFLFGLEAHELQGPLLQFQFVLHDVDELRKLVHSIVNHDGSLPISEQSVDENFDMWWPQLKQSLDNIHKEHDLAKRKKGNGNKSRNQEAMLAELLTLVRNQQRLLSDPALLIPQKYLSESLISTSTKQTGIFKELHFRWRDINELIEHASNENDMPITEIIDQINKLGEFVNRVLIDEGIK